MKKIILLVLTLLLSLSLISCSLNDNQNTNTDTPSTDDGGNGSGNNDDSGSGQAKTGYKDNDNSYYILVDGLDESSDASFKDSNKMTDTDFDDEAVKLSGVSKTGINFLYKVSATVSSADNLNVNFIRKGKRQVNLADTSLEKVALNSNITYGNYQFKVTAAGEYTFVLAIYQKKIAVYARLDKAISNYGDDYTKYSGEINLPGSNLNLQDNIQDGVILHAFNWGYNAIKEYMADIAAAGFTAVQTSPVQQPKDYHESYPTGWAEQWPKLYQPLSFSFAESGWLGTKAEFKAMCDEAEKFGVKVIVDIVANHLANNVIKDSDESNVNKKAELYSGSTNNGVTLPGVGKFEPELYNNQSKYVRSYISPGDGSAKSVVQGNNGWPDLNTGDSYVQSRVISLINECIECGADGFRFDAAKHIETPDDGDVASQFWPNVLNAAQQKAGSNKLYFYGEILNTPGNGRSYSYYTKYMSVTDNKTGNGILQSIINGNASGAANANYNVGSANKAVLWAESHDTYANTKESGATTKVSVENINKAWAMVGSRKDATALYLSRPTSMGDVGKLDFTNEEVKAVNLFHNYFVGASEYVGSSGNFAFVERKASNGETGIVIVNVKGTSASVNITGSMIADGKYYDQITGAEFNVSGKKITGQMGRTGIVVLRKDNPALKPNAVLNHEGGVFSQQVSITLTLENAESALVTINGQVLGEYTANATIKLDNNNTQNGQIIDMEVTTLRGDYLNRQKYRFIRLDGTTSSSVIITDVPAKYLDTSKWKVWAWVWTSGGDDGQAIACTINNGYVICNGKPATKDNILLVTTPSNITTFSWNYKNKQTKDIALSPDNIASAPESMWS